MAGRASEIEIRPLSTRTWDDFVELFGPDRGASGGCWCMFWRQSREDWKARTRHSNQKKIRRLVKPKAPPGLLAYRDGKPVGWVSIAPRDEFPRLNASQYLKPVDRTKVWAVVCFYIRRGHRKSGVASALLAAAVESARKRGAQVVEGYPVARTQESGDAFTGLPSMFAKAGFKEVERRHPSRPIVRKTISAKRKTSARG
jgi:GNAT superfamily N-acetyltransferase